MSVQDLKYVSRLLKEISDLDTQELVFVSYYMKLYVIEIILKRGIEDYKDRAIGFLDDVEGLKKTVDDSANEDEGAHAIVHDLEGKGKIYVLNFTVTLYNSLLKKQVDLEKSLDENMGHGGLGPVNSLISGFWCCIDLFAMVQETWLKEDIEAAKEVGKKTQFGKLMIKKLLVKKKCLIDKIGADEISGEIQDGQEKPQSLKSTSISEEKNNSVSEFKPENDNQEDVPENDNKEDVPDFVDEAPETSPEPALGLPSAPKFLDDSDKDELQETEIDAKQEIPTPSQAHEEHSKPLSEQEIMAMMDWATLITKAQKHSKFGISAMNYDDVDTAVTELQQALDILKILKTKESQD
ncbi:Vacuolar protein sorting-associated protein VTA1 [Hanseniaspora osmophila]|uniref:Vacuolar protein sorting-associated protein VTA1 n=1 Tax=Hanseniaspora osmophila TaxID=56408 RepID=A0A1E5RI39_9ASCO|nr:Vacuolar protein sorting-associated protein VTA1 [Hanseniaspora osmophila]